MNHNTLITDDWQVVKVKDIAIDIQYGYTESSSSTEIGPKFLRITDIQDNKVNWHTVPYCKISPEDKAKKKLEDGDLVFARTGATVGKSFLIKGKIPDAVFASYLIRLRFPKSVSDKYVYYYFQSPLYWKQISEGQVGIGQPNVNGTKLGQLSIPIPSLATQQLIVSKIEELFSELDKGIENLKTAQQQLKVYRQAVLKWAFEGRLTNQNVREGELPEGWKFECLNDVSRIISGFAFKSSDFVNKGIPVVKISNVGYSEFVWKDQEYLPHTFLKSNHDFILKSGDLLIALTRPITNDTIKICKYPQNTPPGLLNQRVACIKDLKIKKDYLFQYFQTTAFREYIRSKLSETLQPNLSPKTLGLITIPACSLEEQGRVIQEIESRFSVADKLGESINDSLLQAEALRQSILKKAFEGKLIS
ncbi:MAG: Type restriction enzyme subunit [Bacteroidetes bacterium]|nr:Type restriction enzyme subunit [Bacteroidota bacterium]